jgi:acylglycerol lipase
MTRSGTLCRSLRLRARCIKILFAGAEVIDAEILAMQYTAQWTELTPSKRKFVHLWEPSEEPQAAVCIVHGLGEHGGRYERLAAELVKSNIAVVAFDQTGHGHSPGQRGCIESYDALLDDIELVLEWTHNRFAHVRPILFGHSMGGNLVLNYAFKRKPIPSAVISSSPMILVPQQPGWLFEKFARMIMRIAPDFRLRSRVVAASLMSDPYEQQLLIDDPLFHSQLSLRLAAALLDTGRWLLKNASQLPIQTLLVHGTQDCRTSHIASSQFAEQTKACELQLYEGQLHDTFRDLERAHVIERFVTYIHSHSYQVAS